VLTTKFQITMLILLFSTLTTLTITFILNYYFSTLHRHLIPFLSCALLVEIFTIKNLVKFYAIFYFTLIHLATHLEADIEKAF
jgi:hypothetical protein